MAVLNGIVDTRENIINDEHITEDKSRLNFCDPFVIFDPAFNASTVAKGFTSDNASDTGRMAEEQAMTMVDAIKIPIIKVNNRVIPSQDIISLNLYYDEFLPHIDCAIHDSQGLAKFADTPGFENVITIIMTMPGEVTYKKISLDFQITSFSPVGQNIYYSGEYKYLPLETIQHKQIKCTNPECQSEKLSTWELLWTIAKELKLGFAATESCKSISDNRYRICSGKKYKEYLLNEISFSGLDENSFFDVWIDLNGYIVMINVSWLLKTEVKTEELSIKVAHNIQSTSTDATETKWTETNRTLTDFPMQPTDNSMKIESWEDISDNNIYYNGASKSFTGFTLSGGQSENTKIDKFDIQYKEDSKSGIKDASNYQQFQRWFFSGIEMSDEIPVLQQKTLRENFFEKQRTRILKVLLVNQNFGLQRGSLVNVMIYETDKVKKYKLIEGMTNYGDTDCTEWSDEQSQFLNEVTDDGKGETPICNYTISGMYYIDKMEFQYSERNQKIQQYLYLIQKNSYHFTLDDKNNIPSFKKGIVDSENPVETNNNDNSITK